jgi:hypothetical protein
MSTHQPHAILRTLLRSILVQPASKPSAITPSQVSMEELKLGLFPYCNCQVVGMKHCVPQGIAFFSSYICPAKEPV